MQEVKEFILDLSEMEVINLINNFKESQSVYLFRKEHGYTFTQFRNIVKEFRVVSDKKDVAN